MKFDFSKPAPRAQSLKESQQIIDALWGCAVQRQTSQQTLTSAILTGNYRLSKREALRISSRGGMIKRSSIFDS